MARQRRHGTRETATRVARTTAALGLACLVATCQAATPSASGDARTVVAPAGAAPRSTPAPSAVARTTPTPAATASATGPATRSTTISHVIVVWMENRDASAVTSASMPYLYGLSETYGRADQNFAVTHPSLPNYLAFWSGSTQGVTDDGVHDLAAESLSNQLAAAGLSWRIYAQDYPAGGCNTGGSYSGGVDGPGVAGTYARKHNPAMSFTFVSGSSQCANIQPLARFDPSVNVAFVAPNLCNDMHDCSAAQGDAFLRAFLPAVFAAPGWPHTLLVVTFDEGSTDVHGGGRVFTLVARQGLSGMVSTIPHDHYGLLRTVEGIFGLPCLGAACDATALSEFLP